MAREDKRAVELRPVDENVVRKPVVVRLHLPDMEPLPPLEEPVRLGHPDATAQSPSRLEVPKREEIDMRTHQPGIEALIESETATTDLPEHRWGEASVNRHPIPWGWFALIALVIIGAGLWAFGHWHQAGDQAEMIRAKTLSALEREAQEQAQAREQVDRIEQALRVYFETTTVDALARLVRHPERVKPLMSHYYARQPVANEPLSMVRILQPLTLDNHGNFWMASVSLASGASRNLIIEIDDHGDPRIDWETLVCYQPMAWNEFARQRPTGTSLDFRVYVEPDNFHSHEFSDSGQWLCYRLTAMDAEETLFGYIRRDQPEAAALQQLIRLNGGHRASLILRLLIPEGLQSRHGVVIEKVLSPRWLFVDPPTTDS